MQSTERPGQESQTGPSIPAAESTLTVPAVKRAVAILEVLGDATEPLSLAKLTVLLGYPKRSVLDICNTLASAGLLECTNRSEYRLGSRIAALADSYLGKSNLTNRFSKKLPLAMLRD